MTARLALLAEPADSALHGLDGRFAWGEARTFVPGDPRLEEFDPTATIAIADAARVCVADVLWLAVPASETPVGRVIAPGGEGLWRRAPLPIADGVWALRDRPGAGVLVVGGEDEARAAAAAALGRRGVEVRTAARLTFEGLAAADIVVLGGPPGAPLAAGAFAVAAARRLLVAPRAEPAFGLLAGVDHLDYQHPDEIERLADAAASFPGAFAPLLAMGSLTAEAQRAEVVYRRLMVDLALEAAIAPA